MVASFLLIAVFVVELVSTVVDAIGYSAIAAMLWGAYSRVSNNRKAQKRAQLRASITQMRNALRTISSVDEFARWAKLRRRLDGESAEFERVSGELAIERTAFSLYVNLVLRVVVYGTRAALGLYYYRTAVFYVPGNWFYPVVWTLSLPSAPMGSVSVAVWAFACNRVCRRAAGIYDRVMRPVDVAGEQQRTAAAM
ncbi:GET complex subunit get1 [Coemansia sp. RSA 2607]|nr:GET complex subunit get1 [Coemansia sp. RSA 2607]KAJ2384579.1 GET complex subunit get1 [Coemansia sp. RSA 2603]